MSRCFPFPPPGYESKEKSSFEDLLVKEKHEEKKHKKEKRDKEKREGKDKKEKDRSKDKHKEKKDKKEKHKEKKKDKDRDKDKTKVLANSIDRPNDSHHGGSLGESSQKTEETNHSKFTLELARRVNNEEKEKASRMVENYNGSVQKSINGLDSSAARVMERVAVTHSMSPSIIASQRTHEMGRTSNNITSSTTKVESQGSTLVLQKARSSSESEQKLKVLADSIDRRNDSHHEGSLGESSQKTEETNHSKFTLELARRVKDEEKEKASRMVENYNGSVQKNTNGLDSSAARVMERVAGTNSMSPSIISSQRTHEMGRTSNNLTSSTRKVESLGGSTLILQKARSSSESEQKLKNAGQRGTNGSVLPMGKPGVSVQGRSDVPYSSTAGEVGKLTQRTMNGIHRSLEGMSSISNKAFNAISFSTKDEDRGVNKTSTMQKSLEGISSISNKAFNTFSFSTKAEDRDVNKTSTNRILLGQRNVEGIVRSLEDASEKSIEGKEKKKDKKSKKDKHRDKNRDEKSKRKKEKDKLKEKEKEKTKLTEEGEPRQKIYDEPVRKKDHVEHPKVKPLTLQSVDENMKKRKEIEINGVLHGELFKKNDHTESLKVKPLTLQSVDKRHTIDENMKKRKEIETNGVLHGELFRKKDHIETPKVKPLTLQSVDTAHSIDENMKKRKEIEINGVLNGELFRKKDRIESLKVKPLTLQSAGNRHSIDENMKRKEIEINGVMHGELYRKKDHIESPKVKPLTLQSVYTFHSIDENIKKRKEIEVNGVLHGELLGKKDHIESLKVKPLTLQSVDKLHSIDKNIKKRKEIEINGVLHENILPPKKIPRTTPSPRIIAENGSTLELPQISSASSSMMSGAMKNIIPGQKPADVSKSIPNSATEAGLRHPVAQDFDLASKDSLRPPHPDAKYLSNIYTVTKLDQWPEHGDQEWLFSNSKLKRKPESQVGADENPQVWATAVRIDQEEILALPYVVPF